MKASKLIVAFLILIVGLFVTGCTTVLPSPQVQNTEPAVETIQKAQKEKEIEEKLQKAEEDFRVELASTALIPVVLPSVQIIDVPKQVPKKEVKPAPIKKIESLTPVPAPAKRVEPVKPVARTPDAILVMSEEVKPASMKPASKQIAKNSAKLPELPPNAIGLIPMLRKYLDMLWPDVPARSYIGAKIEQETCISLKHSKCWSTRAELKTPREYGFGLGQITVAFNKNGTERFNVWKDLIRIDPVLKQKWTWDNRFDAELQIRAVVIKSKMSIDAIRFAAANATEKLAFGLVTYNSGSVLIDRRLCMDVKRCDPSKWFGNVELYSSKSRIAQKGYGKSFYEISREYPRNIMFVRRPKYIPYLDN